MTEAEIFAGLFLAGVICIGLLILAGIAAFLEASPERQAWADRWVRRILG